MRLVIETEPGKLELNYMWLPTWVGMSHPLKKEIEDKIGEDFVGKELSEDTLDLMDEAIIKLLQSKFPMISFSNYLRALKGVEQTDVEQAG